jgi:nucleoside-diphosphate-sugar epimerase
MKTALVLGAGGFIGNHMVKRLKEEGYWVRGVDLKYPEYGRTEADHFVLRDLRHADDVYDLIGWAGVNRDPHQIFALKFDKPFDEIYQFAADMGGAGYIFTGNNDADIMHNSATINLNVLDAVREKNKRFQQNTTKIFYSSSACMYPEHNQLDPNNPNCAEDSAYPANPDSEYGWEKLFSERLYLAFNRNHDIPVRIARFHNIYGPLGTWDGGREKAPAAICRKVIQSRGEIEVWGDGEQTRSFLYIDDCIDAVRKLMESDFMGPVNIGSEEMVTINELVDTAAEIGKKKIAIKHIPGPTGVRGRNSDNRLIWEKLHWKPQYNLRAGLEFTYDWIEEQVQKKVNKQMKDAITL